MTMPLTKMFTYGQRREHLGRDTDAGRRRDQADYGQIHLQFLGMFKVDVDDEAAAFRGEDSDFTFADGKKFSKKKIDKLLKDHAENPTRLWQFRDKKRELEEMLEGRRKNGKTTRSDGTPVPKISREEYLKRLSQLRLLVSVAHTEKLLRLAIGSGSHTH